DREGADLIVFNRIDHALPDKACREHLVGGRVFRAWRRAALIDLPEIPARAHIRADHAPEIAAILQFDIENREGHAGLFPAVPRTERDAETGLFMRVDGAVGAAGEIGKGRCRDSCQRKRRRRPPDHSSTTRAWRFLPAVSLTRSANSPAPRRSRASRMISSFIF